MEEKKLFGVLVIKKGDEEKGLPIWNYADPFHAGKTILAFCHRHTLEGLNRLHQTIFIDEDENDNDISMEDAFWRFERGEKSVFLCNFVEEIKNGERVCYAYVIDLDKMVIGFYIGPEKQKYMAIERARDGSEINKYDPCKLCYEYPLEMIQSKGKSIPWNQIMNTILSDMNLFCYMNDDLAGLYSENMEDESDVSGFAADYVNQDIEGYISVNEKIHQRNVTSFNVWTVILRDDHNQEEIAYDLDVAPDRIEIERALAVLMNSIPYVRPSDRIKSEKSIYELTRIMLYQDRRS